MEIIATITPTGITKVQLHVPPESADEGAGFFARMRPMLLEMHQRIQRGEFNAPAKALVEDDADEFPDEWLTPQEAAAFLGVSEHTLANWRFEGVGPKFHKLGSGPKARVRYRRSDLEAAMQPAKCRRATTTNKGRSNFKLG